MVQSGLSQTIESSGIKCNICMKLIYSKWKKGWGTITGKTAMPRADTLGQFNEMEADCAANLPVHARGNVYRVKQSIVANFFARFQIAACCVSVIAISSCYGLSLSLSFAYSSEPNFANKNKNEKEKIENCYASIYFVCRGGRGWWVSSKMQLTNANGNSNNSKHSNIRNRIRSKSMRIKQTNKQDKINKQNKQNERLQERKKKWMWGRRKTFQMKLNSN